MVDLRQLRYFQVVSDELHFGRAAHRLNISQPPLSVQIRRLERELGAELFQRSTRRVTLTEAGRALTERIGPILAEVDALHDLVDEAALGHRGSIDVGFVSSANLTVFPPALRLFRERYERVQLNLHELATAQQIEALHKDEIDVGLVRAAAPAVGLRITPVLEERLVAVIPEGHPLAQYDIAPVELLADEPMVLVPHRLMPSFYESVLTALRTVGARPRVVQQGIHQETIIGLVAAGIGLSLLPESVTRLQRHGVVYRHIDAEQITIPLSIATREDGYTLQTQHFLDCVYQAAKAEATELFPCAQQAVDRSPG